MIAHAEHLPQNCALTSLNQMERISETAPPSLRGSALSPVVTRLGSLPKLPLQDCVRAGSVSLQPDSAGRAVRNFQNWKISSHINALMLVTRSGGETHPLRGWGRTPQAGSPTPTPRGFRARGLSWPEHPDPTTAVPYRQAHDRRRLPPEQPTTKETAHG